MRSPRPAQAKFIRVAAACRAVTPGSRPPSRRATRRRRPGPRPARRPRARQVGVPVRLACGGGDQLGHERDDLLAQRGDLGGEGLAVGAGLDVQHRPAVRVLGGVREERRQAVPELAVGGQTGGPGAGPDGLDEGPRLAPDAGAEEVFLGVQVQVDQRLGDAGQFGDLVHRGGHVAALPEDRHGGVQHLLLTDRTRHPLGLPCTHADQRTVRAAVGGNAAVGGARQATAGTGSWSCSRRGSGSSIGELCAAS